MNVKIIRKNQKSITIEVDIPITDSMLTGTDGSAIKVNGETYSSKGKVAKAYQTPYGEIAIDRNVRKIQAAFPKHLLSASQVPPN
jgi:hypothetical protein